MFEYAQTNLQLFQQMDERGYGQADRERVALAYRQLMPMFSGLYRGNDKPFIAHLIGTASILVSGRIPVEQVLAGLLHAVYMAGDFGFQPGTRQTVRKRRLIRDLAGEEAESIITAYDASSWSLESVSGWLSAPDSLSDLDRAVIRLQLANTLEDLLDHGVNYCTGSKSARMSCAQLQQGMLSLSRSHAWPSFSQALEQALRDFNTAKTPVDRAGFLGQSKLILPPSSARRMLPTAQGGLVRRLRRLKDAIR